MRKSMYLCKVFQSECKVKFYTDYAERIRHPEWKIKKNGI